MLDVEKGQLEWALNQDYDGFNITAPYKKKVWKFLKSYPLDKIVNTITRDKHGENTDRKGFQIR